MSTQDIINNHLQKMANEILDEMDRKIISLLTGGETGELRREVIRLKKEIESMRKIIGC